MDEEKTFYAPGVSIRGLADRIEGWLRMHDFDTQSIGTADRGLTIQARQRGSLRAALGISSALTIVFTPMGDNLKVQMGAARWADKLAVGAVGLFIHPLLITAAYGAWRQSQLPDQIVDIISQYIGSHQRPGRSVGSGIGSGIIGHTAARKIPIGSTLDEGAQTDMPEAKAAGSTLTEAEAPQSPSDAGPESGPESNQGSSQTASCPGCGEPLGAASRYCSQCGARVGGPVPVEIR